MSEEGSGNSRPMVQSVEAHGPLQRALRARNRVCSMVTDQSENNLLVVPAELHHLSMQNANNASRHAEDPMILGCNETKHRKSP